MVVTMAIRMIIAYGLMHVQEARKCQPQLPQAAPLKDLADGWARELVATKDDNFINLLEGLLSRLPYYTG